MKKIVKNYGLFILAGIAALTIVMSFLPGVKATVMGIASKATGMETTYGDNGTDFNFWSFLGFVVLPVIAVIVAFIIKGRMGKLIACALFVVAAIFIFMTGIWFGKVNDVDSIDWSLQIGPILGGIIAIIGAGWAFLLDFLK